VIEITGDPDSPKRSTRIDPAWARAQILQYGADNPWVLANVFGKFPSSSPLVVHRPGAGRSGMQARGAVSNHQRRAGARRRGRALRR
jgi:hypothetical protein